MRTNSKFVVCDRGNERSRMQIFTKNGHFIKKIAIRLVAPAHLQFYSRSLPHLIVVLSVALHFRYIDIVAGLAVTNQGHIVAVDSVSPTVFIISEDGELVRWFDCSDYMREPSDIAISGEYTMNILNIKFRRFNTKILTRDSLLLFNEISTLLLSDVIGYCTITFGFNV